MSTESEVQLKQRIELLERKLARERAGKFHAEMLLEDKSRSLYQLNQELSQAYDTLKKQEIQIIQQEKMASIGQLSAGVAHEINTPTGFVMSNLETLTDYIKQLVDYLNKVEVVTQSNSTINEQLKQIQEQYELDYLLADIPNLIKESRSGMLRIKNIVGDLRAFSHADKQIPVLVNIAEIMQQTLHLVKNEIKHTAQLTVDITGNNTVMGFAGKLSQVFLNLLVNATQAFEKGVIGQISIRVYEQQNYCIINIKDNGMGIADEHLKKIFDPFFSTKEVGKGTGLGLAISKEIINQHMGDIVVDSQVGLGSEFIIRIPLAKPEQNDIKA